MHDRTELLHYEDFPVGKVAMTDSIEFTADFIRDFAAEWDPQPFHLDEAEGRSSVLGGLSASGWQVCSVITRLSVDAYAARSAGMGSFGVSEVRWIRPVLEGDRIRVRYTVLDRRVSSKRPEMGILTVLWEAIDQDGTLKATMTGIELIRVRQPAEAAR